MAVKRILFGHSGLRGDLVINLPAIKWLHKHEPDWLIDMPIHRPLADMVPLFQNLPYLNGTIITEAHDGFPSEGDLDLLRHRAYDMVGNPMQPHKDDRWHQRIHQTAAVLEDYLNQPLPLEEQQIELTRWFEVDDQPHWVALAPFAGFASNPINPKRLTVERAQETVNHLRKRGFCVLQLGGKDEPPLQEATQFLGSYFEAVKAMLGCRALISTDTGMGWVASGYKHPSLGLYSDAYHGADKVCNIQPRNPNALFLSAPNVNEIPFDKVAESLHHLIN